MLKPKPKPANFSDVVEHIKTLGEHAEHLQPIELMQDGDLVDMTSAAFPMYVPVLDYIGSLQINQLEQFETLEEQGGVNLAKFDLQRGIIITVKFAAFYDLRYFEKLRALRNTHQEFQPIFDPLLYSYPNEDEGDEPIGELVMIYDGQNVRVAGLVTPWYEEQENVWFYETLSLGKALLLLELTSKFAAIATDNGTRPLNY